ncbi:MAG TPA: ectonucleotide pyrophosphatase/phosphodiesterase [Tepidisphaeraceae bacterium]|jgi:predicted AlkP superfamily pyrophosphatase or phosphodiesterase|nr:ectonucleotide pyrophosphatase/phosphodiesterase [Tepidisphaeraceae bacterium]
MHKLHALLLSAFLILAVGGVQAADRMPDRAVIMISVDGLAQYYLDDPNAQMPTIRQLAAEGARARMMKASVPTVTWPNHTTLVTGVQPARHGVVGNNYFDRVTGKVVTLITDPIYDKEQIVKSPTIYDLAKANGLSTAAVIWPATRNARTLDWTVPDVATDELFQKYGTPALLAECKAAGIDYSRYGEWNKAGRYDLRDQLNTRIFNLILETHRPNLALLHLINVDHIEHLKGPQTPEAYAAVKEADQRVREVWDEARKVYPGKASIVIVSDHGFFPIRQAILPNVILHQAGLLDVKGPRIVSAQIWAVSQGGCAFIYVLDDAHRDALIDRAAGLFKDVEGVDVVLKPADFARYGVATPKQDPHMPDVILFARSGYSFGDTSAGQLAVTTKSAEVRGTHGHDPNQPGMHATFVAWGAGVKAGAKLGVISNADVAPTVAALLGFTMKDVDGKVLDDALEQRR